MSYHRLGKHVRISPGSPQAAAVCDRCGLFFNHVNLRWQHDYAGAGLINKRLLVCRTCEDRPQSQLRAIVLPADPVPIQNPRIPDYAASNNDRRITQGPTITDPITGLQKRTGDTRITAEADARVVEQNGDALFKPDLVAYERVTSNDDGRSTQNNKRRVTQLRRRIKPAPLPPAFPVEVLATEDGKIRLTESGSIRRFEDNF